MIIEIVQTPFRRQQLCYKIEVLKHLSVSEYTKFTSALAHTSNTVTQKNYCYGDHYLSNLTLDNFPMRDEDREFYRNLHKPIYSSTKKET